MLLMSILTLDYYFDLKKKLFGKIRSKLKIGKKLYLLVEFNFYLNWGWVLINNVVFDFKLYEIKFLDFTWILVKIDILGKLLFIFTLFNFLINCD